MQKKRFLVLLVVLALSSMLLSGIADSAVRTMVPDGTDEVQGGAVFKEGGGDDGGDDDRWGGTSPSVPIEDDPETGFGTATPAVDPDGTMVMMFTAGELWSMQVRFLLSRMLIGY